MNRDPEAWARLGRALRRARERRGLTQQDLATAASISGRSVQDAESGKVPRARMPYTLASIANALGWPAEAVEQVLEGHEPPTDAGEWRTINVQPEIDASEMEGIITQAMVRATETATSAEIKEATRLALDEMRRRGLIPQENVPQSGTSSRE